MKLLLAVICFITMLLHAFFGYYLYTQGENVFYPEKVKAMLLEIVPPQPEVQPPAAQAPATPAAPATNVAPQPAPQAAPSTEPAPAPAEESATPQQPASAPAPEHNSASLSLPNNTLATVTGWVSESAVAEETAVISDFKMDDFGAKYKAIMDTLGITPLLQAPNPPVTHPSFITGWSGYLQIQNALITFFLFILGLAVCCVKGRGSASRWVFAINFFFWISLGCFTWFWHPVNTPLAVIRLNFSFPGWYFIVGLSMFGALLSLLLFFAAMRSKEIPLKKDTPDVVKKEIEQSKLPPKVKQEVEAVAAEASRADPMAAQFAGQVVEGEHEARREFAKDVAQLEKRVKAEVSKVEENLEKEEETHKGGFSFGRKAKKAEAKATATATAAATATVVAKSPDESVPPASTKDVAQDSASPAPVAEATAPQATPEEEKTTPQTATESEHPIVDTGSKVLRNLQNENGIKEDDSVIIPPPPDKK